MNVGIIGCGGVMRGAHLPAYRDFGYQVTACCDLIEANAKLAQQQFSIPFMTTSVDEILHDYPQLAREDVLACIAYGSEMSRERYVDIPVTKPP